MPCADSSSGLNIQLDLNERFLKFEFAKITCSSEIRGQTGLSEFCAGKTIPEILAMDHPGIVAALELDTDDERQFIAYLELEALQSAVMLYCGMNIPSEDPGRFLITSIERTEQVIAIHLVVLPPKELPKIIPCGMASTLMPHQPGINP